MTRDQLRASVRNFTRSRYYAGEIVQFSDSDAAIYLIGRPGDCPPPLDDAQVAVLEEMIARRKAAAAIPSDQLLFADFGMPDPPPAESRAT